jgi:hypothetical protein
MLKVLINVFHGHPSHKTAGIVLQIRSWLLPFTTFPKLFITHLIIETSVIWVTRVTSLQSGILAKSPNKPKIN